MANEVRVQLNLRYNKNSRVIPIDDSFWVDVSGDEYTFQRQEIGTAAEVIDIGGDIATKGWLYIKNKDAANYVLLGLRTTKLNYDNVSGGFTEGLLVTGGTSAATGWLIYVVDEGIIRVLVMSHVSGTFQDNETITDSGSGSATVNGTASNGSAAYFSKLKAGEACLVRVTGADALMAVADTSACDVEYFLIED